MRFIPGGITAPIGFKANGLSCGIKKSGKKDLSLIYSETMCDAVGTFTTNKVSASCVAISSEHLKNGKAQAIIANSGNANCMTGKYGFKDSRTMTALAAKELGLKGADVCVASTGVIGHPLPIQLIEKAVPELAKGLSAKGSRNAAQGIMTTDHMMKEAAVEIMIGKTPVRIGAIAKGAGMIHPEMALAPASSAKSSGGPKHATMLCFVTTDASIAPTALREALNAGVQDSFNMITIDGDMSTNDMVLVLANGMAKNKKISAKSKEARVFAQALQEILLKLAQLIVKDAEGATKFVEVTVSGAASREDARKAARTVASSNLVKCALFGSDPNWGRIAAAAGRSGAHVDSSKMKIYLGNELVLKNGGEVKKGAGVLDKVFAKKDIKISLDLGLGKHSAVAYTCDLSTKYVTLNSAYHT
ncbi:MAG: bifunctional glutamate N-acetyltransferase/amino-acid acetyltransferase ArgJ [bacterium]|nr:bifunctional glutamate N-acetyltransferase/amino-acid acetyltransferase ArgJ [bacterium]